MCMAPVNLISSDIPKNSQSPKDPSVSPISKSLISMMMKMMMTTHKIKTKKITFTSIPSFKKVSLKLLVEVSTLSC